MAQIKRFSWTNPSSAVAKKLDVGFTAAEVVTIDVTNGGSWKWVNGMGDGYYLDVDAGSIGTSNGVTPYTDSANYGATISGFTNANPGVITVDDTVAAGFATGDTIKVTGIADDQSAATSLNGTYTIASTTSTTITTATNTSAYSVWVSGGKVSRVSDTNGDPVPAENFANRGVTLGSGVVGANSAVMVAIVKGEESVT